MRLSNRRVLQDDVAQTVSSVVHGTWLHNDIDVAHLVHFLAAHSARANGRAVSKSSAILIRELVELAPTRYAQNSLSRGNWECDYLKGLSPAGGPEIGAVERGQRIAERQRQVEVGLVHRIEP